ncbi:MAG TPA: DUF389 domain-containing protein [Chloroflexi bacterium]|nr:DUF389 domain-containing protein [Chloroflexota bacterium]
MSLSSHGLVLVVADKAEAFHALLKLAMPYARRGGKRITLLHLEHSPDVGEAFTEPPKWLRKLAGKISEEGISVHIMAGHSPRPARTIRETVRQLKADFLILGWREDEPARGRKLGPVLTPLLSDPPCDLAVMRLRRSRGEFKQVLVPTAGGPNARLAIEVAYALAEGRDGEVSVLYVLHPGADLAQHRLAEETIAQSAGSLAGSPVLSPCITEARSPTEGILAEAGKGYDLILIGASREGVIARVLFGEIPLKVAREAEIPVVIVKQRPSPAMQIARRGWDRLFSLFPTLTEEEKIAAYREVRRGARPDVDFFVMMGLSAAIASMGLLLSSPAIIIGAMLVAPLMSAVIGLGLGVVQGDLRFLKLTITSVFKGMLLAIIVSLITAFVIPVRNPTSEIMARTQPTLLDLGVALASGIAGAYAICRKDVSTALPGVAIAAALIPPLATSGIGLALLDWKVTAGAMLLFLTNLVAIATGGGVVFLLLGFGPEARRKTRFRVFERSLVGLGVLLLTIFIILGFLSFNALKHQRLTLIAREVVTEELASSEGTTLEEVGVEEQRGGGLEVTITVRSSSPIGREEIERLRDRLSERLGRGVTLEFTRIPTIRVEP